MAPANSRRTARNPQSRRSEFSSNVPLGLRYLPSLDPKSKKFVELLQSFLSSKDEGANILTLSEGDARLSIEIIDKASFSRTTFGFYSSIFSPNTKTLRAAVLEPELRQLAFDALRELCGRIGHLPKSYLLSDRFGPPELSHAFSGFADVRMGWFKDKNVAVKTLRVSTADDKAWVRKVGIQATSSHLGPLTHRTALL